MEYRVASNELSHHGILGMKWGVRRYQNSDGSLTEAGKKRYSKSSKTKEDYHNSAEKHRKRAANAVKISMASAIASVPAALYTLGTIGVATALTPAAIGGLAVTTALSGTAGISKAIAIGEAAVANMKYNKANKVDK